MYIAENRKKKADKLFNSRPFLFSAIFLCLGIVFSYYRIFYALSFWWLVGFIPMGLLFFLFSTGKEDAYKRLALALFFCLCFLGGYFSLPLQLADYADCEAYEGEVTLIGRVENRSESESGVKLLLGDLYVDGEKTAGKLVAYTSSWENAQLADIVLLKGEIKTNVELLQNGELRCQAIFDGRRYLLYCEEKGSVVGRSNNIFLNIRARMTKVVYASMEEDAAALTVALLTGDCSGVDEGLMDNMRYGGISHIFAVSGLNIGALFAFCLFLFAKTPLKRSNKFLRFLIMLSILWLYVGVCGFTSSVVRAAAACSIAYATKLLGMGIDPLNGLGFAAIFILLLTPSELFGVGFQLSFAACAGLLLLSKRIGQVFDEICFLFKKPRLATGEISFGERVRQGFGGVLSASLAAQLTAAPILLLRFGYISGWSLLLNLVFVPVIDGIFTLLLVVVLLACCLPLAFGKVFLFLPSVIWSALILVFEVADFSNFQLEVDGLPVGGVICFYVAITLLSDKWNLPKGLRRGFALLFFLAFLGLTIAKQAFIP